MHIWIAPSAFFPHRGGVEELTLQLSRELGGRGHSVLVVTNQYPRSLHGRETVEGVNVRRIPFTAPSSRPGDAARFLFGQPSIQKSLDALLPRPDIVHLQCPSVQTAPLTLYAKRHGIPLVLTSQGEVSMDAGHLYTHSLYMRLTFRAAARAAAKLTACSAWTATQCQAYAPRFSNAVVIPNGVDPRQWEVGAITERPILCAWGRHVHEKGFDLAISAFTMLRQRISDARLLIGGEGAETSKLQDIAGPGVEFLGPIDRAGVGALLAASRVAIVPSRVEPFGIVALEALASGRGLVYAADTGIGEAAGELGRPADVYDPSAFAEAMEAELVRPTDRTDGHDRAQHLSWNRICGHYLEVYEQARAS